MMQAYKTWLHFEHRAIAWEMANHPRMIAYYGGRREDRYEAIEPLISFVDVGEAHRYHHHNASTPPSGRAALVMSTVGCDWREREG